MKKQTTANFLRPRDIPAYIFRRTGVTPKLGQVRYWIRIGEIETFTLPNRQNQRATTKQIVDRFIRRHVRGTSTGKAKSSTG